MHELSIANMLLGMVAEHAPSGVVVRSVRVEAGPMQAIEPEAMRLAWLATTDSTPLHGATLDLRMMPFDLRCPHCGRGWQSDDLFQPCVCGCDRPRVTGGDRLILVSIDVKHVEPETPSAPTACTWSAHFLRGGASCKSP